MPAFLPAFSEFLHQAFEQSILGQLTEHLLGQAIAQWSPPEGAPPGVGYNRVRSKRFGPLVKVPVDGMFSKDFSTRL